MLFLESTSLQCKFVNHAMFLPSTSMVTWIVLGWVGVLLDELICNYWVYCLMNSSVTIVNTGGGYLVVVCF